MHESFISSLDPCHIQLCDHNFTSAAYEKSASSSTLPNTTDFLQLRTHVKTHKLLQVCKQVVTKLMSISRCIRTACSQLL